MCVGVCMCFVIFLIGISFISSKFQLFFVSLACRWIDFLLMLWFYFSNPSSYRLDSSIVKFLLTFFSPLFFTVFYLNMLKASDAFFHSICMYMCLCVVVYFNLLTIIIIVVFSCLIFFFVCVCHIELNCVWGLAHLIIAVFLLCRLLVKNLNCRRRSRSFRTDNISIRVWIFQNWREKKKKERK